MLDPYRIFRQPHHRRLMKHIANQHIDRIVDVMRSALNDRDEAELWFRSSIGELKREVLAEMQRRDDTNYELEVMLAMMDIMLDEFDSRPIDECFKITFEPESIE